MRRIAAYILTLGALVITAALVIGALPKNNDNPDPDIPTPALGKAVATSIHQALTDPYFVPLERLANYMASSGQPSAVTLTELSSWKTEGFMPTCFTWDVAEDRFDFDSPASPWALEELTHRVKQLQFEENLPNRVYIHTFEADAERYWMGCMRLPRGGDQPVQFAGVFFSLDDYLSEYVPGLVDNVTRRARFPITGFQSDSKPLAGETEGYVSLQILTGDKSIYLRRGRNFDPAAMIYAESAWFDRPVVCLQDGWDLQVFSSHPSPPRNFSGVRRLTLYVFAAVILLVSVFYWWGVTGKSATKEPKPNE